MLAADVPSKIQLPFADAGTKNAIPVPSQISITPGAASYTDGFPPITFLDILAGGIPPDGADVNGILNAITAVQQWQSAGGIFRYDSAFSTAIGGYPKGAILQSTDGLNQWLNLADDNTNDPDTTPTNWLLLNIGAGRGTVTMHATTMDLWAQPNIIDGTGSAVTITAIANAPQAGAVRIVYCPAGTVWTHGATFSVQGGASYTTKAGDAIVVEAVTTSTYNIWILRKTARTVNVVTGSRAAATDYTNSSGGEMLVSVWCNNNNTSGGTGHQFYVDGVVVAQQSYAGAGLAANNASSGTTYEVPNGSTYKVVLSASTIVGWVEQNY